jgi:hypothetical protein
MAISRFEDVMSDLKAEFESIQSGTTYRSSVVLPVELELVDPDSVKVGPKVFIVTLGERLVFINTTKTIAHSEFEVVVGGIVKSDLGNLYDDVNALAHDFKQCLSGFAMKNVNISANRWVVKKDSPPTMQRGIPPKSNYGWVMMQFTVQIFAQASTF